MYRSRGLWRWVSGAAFALLMPDPSLGMPNAEARSDLALVLAVDASGSIDGDEFRMQLNGIANAFRQRAVLDAIQSGRAGAIDVALLLWGGDIKDSVSSGWHRISTDREAAEFAAHVAAHPRHAFGMTSVGNGVMAALALLRKWREGPTGCASMSPETAGRRSCFAVDAAQSCRPMPARERRARKSPSTHLPFRTTTKISANGTGRTS